MVCIAGARRGKSKAWPLDNFDLTNVRYFMEFFKLFYKITICMSGIQYYTAKIYFEEKSTLSLHLHKSCDEAT